MCECSLLQTGLAGVVFGVCVTVGVRVIVGVFVTEGVNVIVFVGVNVNVGVNVGAGGVQVGTAVCVLLGAIAFIRIPVDLMPDTEFPTISVSTTYEGVAPEEMETLITRPIEETLASAPGVEEITSTSTEGNSFVRVRFGYGANLALFSELEILDHAGLAYGGVDTVAGQIGPYSDYITNYSPIPEPSTLVLVMGGLVGVVVTCRKRPN